MTPARRHSAAQLGFTLIELLAALVVFGFLIAGLAESIRFGLTAWRVQTQTVARDADLDQVDRLLSNLVTEIRPGAASAAPTVIGGAHEIAFTTMLPVRIGDPPTLLADARLSVLGGRLVIDLAPHLHAERVGPAPRPMTTVLATGVDHLTVGYYRASDVSWVSRWSGIAPPNLIRFSIGFTDGRRHWPPIVAAPLIARYDQ